ncbi:MAG: hypothetical protein AB8V03_01600 [Francisella endosymbiont of Hyalomma asiaticum]
MKNKISIITIVCEDSLNIDKTLKSVFSQKLFHEIEYIVVDISMAESAFNIINNDVDKIDSLLFLKNANKVDAIKKAIEIARGEWLNVHFSRDVFVVNNLVESILYNISSLQNISIISNLPFESNKEEISILELEELQVQLTFFRKTIVERYGLNYLYSEQAIYDLIIKCYKENSNIFKIYKKTIGDDLEKSTFQSEIERLHILLRNFGESFLCDSLRFGWIYQEGLKNQKAKIKVKSQLLELKKSELKEIRSTNVYKLGSFFERIFLKKKKKSIDFNEEINKCCNSRI